MGSAEHFSQVKKVDNKLKMISARSRPKPLEMDKGWERVAEGRTFKITGQGEKEADRDEEDEEGRGSIIDDNNDDNNGDAPEDIDSGEAYIAAMQNKRMTSSSR